MTTRHRFRKAMGSSGIPAALRFTETMTGPLALGETDPVEGAKVGRREGTELTFRLTIETEDVHTFIAEPDHLADATGWVECEGLGGRFPVERGLFNLFVEDRGGGRTMRYRLWFTDAAGHPLTLRAHKRVADDPGLDVWTDSTTLFTQLLLGHVDQTRDDDAVVTAAGVLRIPLLSFVRQLTTFRTRGVTITDRASALVSFQSFFIGQLWRVYGRRARAAVQRRGRR